MSKIDIILDVYETHSISKTAGRLKYTQSAVSQAIRNYEKEIGVTLFKRSKTGMSPLTGTDSIFEELKKIRASENHIEQIAANIGICRDTLIEWKKKYSDISDTLKRGKDVVDIQVENALLKRALGYTYIETTQERVDDYDPHTGLKTGSHMEVTKTVTKEVQPDTTAQIFWLKNRKPDTWRDKRDVGIEGTLNTNNPFADLSTEDLKKLINHD